MPLRHLSRLRLSHFRNYQSAALDLDGRHLVLVGPNGAGKTNLLEAVSLLSPDRGLRGAPFEDVAAHGSDGAWAVAVTIETPAGPVDIGTGLGPEGGRRVRINGANARTIEDMSDYLRVLWLTPAMDGLFTGPAGDRRRFLDRLVTTLDPSHSATAVRLRQGHAPAQPAARGGRRPALAGRARAQMAEARRGDPFRARRQPSPSDRGSSPRPSRG
jgi:DNA replication and repair protein RecF